MNSGWVSAEGQTGVGWEMGRSTWSLITLLLHNSFLLNVSWLWWFTWTRYGRKFSDDILKINLQKPLFFIFVNPLPPIFLVLRKASGCVVEWPMAKICLWTTANEDPSMSMLRTWNPSFQILVSWSHSSLVCPSHPSPAFLPGTQEPWPVAATVRGMLNP